MSVVVPMEFDLNSAAGKVNCMLCKHINNRITSVMTEHLATKTSNCFVFWPYLIKSSQVKSSSL